jgi:hypothetical protein
VASSRLITSSISTVLFRIRPEIRRDAHKEIRRDAHKEISPQGSQRKLDARPAPQEALVAAAWRAAFVGTGLVTTPRGADNGAGWCPI